MRQAVLSFCVAVVVTLSLLLVPAVAPPVALASPGPDLPNPLTVTFDANITSTGAYNAFNVVPDPGNGSYGVQFSRAPVLYWNNLTNCKFYNISNATGAISGDLSGGISLSWNRLDLNMSYPNSSQWFVGSPDGFGILYIKGNLTTSQLGNFNFVAAGDLDYKSTTVKGAGRICTVIPWQAPPVNGSLNDVLIGEITNYTLTASKISGSLSLRYYNRTKGEIATNWSYMTLSGVLGADVVDNITSSVSLIQFTKNNLVTDPSYTVAMEESTSNREVPQNITGGDFGVGGTLTLNRTGVMSYLRISDMNLPKDSVHAIRNTQDNWNSTTANVTGGLSYSIVVVDMFNFTEAGVDQHAYTFMPGYSPGYTGTGYFAGFESFLIAATHIDLDENIYGQDYSFDLLPTPVVSSVSPCVGQAGQTLSVTIKGKWFLVNETYNPLTISFGPNVTVNSHAVVNDTVITANITIGGGAGTGASNVSVTKRNLTGTLSGGFGVGAAVEGQVTFPGRAGGNANIEPFNVTVKDAGTNNTVWTGTSTTNVGGVFTVTGLAPGSYDIRIKNATCLREKVTNVTLTLGNSTVAVFNQTREGDIDGNNVVNMMDRDYLYFGWGTQNVIQSGYYCDLDRNGWLNMMDRDLMYYVWGQAGVGA